MSNTYEFCFSYDVPYDEDALRTVLQNLYDAVHENWTARSTELSPAKPRYAIEVERRLREAFPIPVIGARPVDASSSKYWDFNFSPTDSSIAVLLVRGEYDGRLFVRVSAREMSIHQGTQDLIEARERNPDFRPPWPVHRDGATDDESIAWWETHEEWWDRYHANHPKDPGENNRDCLFHLFDRLLAALPLREVKLDDRVFTGLKEIPERFRPYIWKIPGVG